MFFNAFLFSSSVLNFSIFLSIFVTKFFFDPSSTSLLLLQKIAEFSSFWCHLVFIFQSTLPLSSFKSRNVISPSFSISNFNLIPFSSSPILFILSCNSVLSPLQTPKISSTYLTYHIILFSPSTFSSSYFLITISAKKRKTERH